MSRWVSDVSAGQRQCGGPRPRRRRRLAPPRIG
jgi:hypothetical protein